MYTKKILIISLLLDTGFSYAQTKILTLEEAIDYAYKNAYSIQSAEQDIQIAKEQIKEFESRKGPQVKVITNYTRNDTGIPQSQFLDNFNVALNASMPLDINNVLSLGVQVAKYNKIILDRSKFLKQINLKSDVKNAAYTILLNSRIMKLSLDQHHTSEINLKNIESRVKNHVTAKYDQYTATRDYEASKAAVFSSELNYNASKKSFNKLIGHEIDHEFQLQDIKELPILNLDENILLMECNRRPDVQTINDNIELQNSKRRIELGALSPSLGVSIDYTQSFKITPKSMPNSHLLAANVALTIPLLDSGIAKSRAKQIDETIKKLEIQKKELLSQIELNLNNILDQLKNAYKQMEANKAGLVAAKEAYRIALLRFNENESIQLEVHSAKDNLTKISIDYETSFFNILKAYSEIERITCLSIDKLSIKNDQ